MATTPFPLDPVQTAIAVAYTNTDYVADQVLPRAPVAAEKFKWYSFPVEESYRRPDTRVGRLSRPNEVTLSLTEELGQTLDYGLEDPVPLPDVEQGKLIGYDPLDHATMQLSDYLMIDREVRVAAKVFAAATYPTGNKVQLSGNDQWSVAHDDSDPIADIVAAINACLVRPNRLLLGHEVWTFLRQHPRIVQAVHGNDGSVGITTRQQVAALFELDRVVVGWAFLNTAKFGQEAVLSRIWGKHALVYRADPIASIGGKTATFGLTAQFLTRFATTTFDRNIGLRGGTRVRVGESTAELVIAPRAAFFIEDAVE